MPRDGSGIYSTPPGTDGGPPGVTIASTPYNVNVHDVEADLNAARPIIAGGTGANNVTQARANLKAEASTIAVTNYDSHTFEAGSFFSVPGATGAPEATGTYLGIAYGDMTSAMFLEARSVNSGLQYVRLRFGGAWGAWSNVRNDLDNRYVETTGDTMTGNLTIATGNLTVDTGNITISTGNLAINALDPTIVLNKSGAGHTNAIQALSAGVNRWVMFLGGAGAESGSNAGSDFVLTRHNDAGTLIDAPITIFRADGALRISNAGIYLNTTNFILSDATNLIFRSGGAYSFQNNTGSVVLMSLSSTGMELGVSAMPGFAGALKVAYAGGASQYGITMRPATNTTSALIFENASAGGIGSIGVTTTGTSFNTSSDERLKEDLKPVTTAGAIIDATNIYDFRWKSTQERALGVIAQQAITVYPAAITHRVEHDWYGVDYGKYVPVLLQEAKTLRQRATDLQDKVDKLNARIEAGRAASLDVAIAVRNAMTAIPDTFTAVNFAAMKIQLDALTEAFAAMLEAQAAPP